MIARVRVVLVAMSGLVALVACIVGVAPHHRRYVSDPLPPEATAPKDDYDGFIRWEEGPRPAPPAPPPTTGHDEDASALQSAPGAVVVLLALAVAALVALPDRSSWTAAIVVAAAGALAVLTSSPLWTTTWEHRYAAGFWFDGLAIAAGTLALAQLALYPWRTRTP